MECPFAARGIGVLAEGLALRHRGGERPAVTEFATPVDRVESVGEVHSHGDWLDWRARERRHARPDPAHACQRRGMSAAGS